MNGVDSGTGTQNTAILSISSPGSLTVGAIQQIGFGNLSVNTGGTLVIFDGGTLNIGMPIWMTDADGDGYPTNTTQILSNTTPLNARRRNFMTSVTITDSNESTTCPDNTNPAGTCNFCNQGIIANQADNQDIFSECALAFNKCNGSGTCTLHAKKVFISSQIYNGNMGNLTGTDSKCQTLANTAGLGNTWKAWASNTSTNAFSRLNQSTLPYILVDNLTKIADNWATLIDGNLDNPILLSETGQNLGTNLRVWTNTKFDGSIFSTSSQSTCTNWTLATPSRIARVGVNSLNSSIDWTDSENNACNTSNHLYCFEQ